MKFLILSLLVLCVGISKSYAGGGDGYDHDNGGDICESRFQTVREDLKDWIKRGGSTNLRLPSKITHDRYQELMLNRMESAKVSCVADKIEVKGAEKTCKNFAKPDGTLHIVCNRNLFLATSSSDQYVLVHHEYAGLAGFEVNTGETSNYEISNQISGFLEEQIVKKLPIKPADSENPFKAASCVGDQVTSQDVAKIVPPQSRDLTLSTLQVFTQVRQCNRESGCTEWSPEAMATEAKYFVALPNSGTVQFVRGQTSVGIKLSTSLHQGSGRGIFMTCNANENGEVNKRCPVVSMPDYRHIGDAEGIITNNCARLTFVDQSATGVPNYWRERQVIFFSKFK